MKVTIPRITEHNGYPGNAITVEISDNCPVCGGKRGEPFPTISYDGSRRLHVDGWENPCGHVDRYSNVREEAAKLLNKVREAQACAWEQTMIVPQKAKVKK